MFIKSKAAILLGALAISEAVLADINKGLVAYWNFDDCTATDISGNNYNGTLHSGSQSGIECVAGVRGKALHFNRVDGDNGAGKPGGDYVVLPALPAIWSKGFTGCAWAEFEAIRHWERIFDFGNGAQLNNITLNSNEPGYIHVLTMSTNNVRYDFDSASKSAISYRQNKYYCVAADNATGVVTIYVNAKQVSTNKTGITNGIVANVMRTSNFLAHSNWPMYDPDLKGTLDEVRVWNRPLSATEIKQAYTQDSHLTGSLSGTGNYAVTCTNTVTNQTITLPTQTAASWDCSAAGFQLGPKQGYHISIDGIGD